MSSSTPSCQLVPATRNIGGRRGSARPRETREEPGRRGDRSAIEPMTMSTIAETIVDTVRV